MKKNTTLQYLRVFATLIVVLGHAIIIYDKTGWGILETNRNSSFLYYLKQYINIFQMPLFFMISGYLFNFSIKKYKNFFYIFIDKFKRLIIPFIFVSLVWLIPIRILIGYNNYFIDDKFNFFIIIKNFCGVDSGHLWFLYILFASFLIYYVFIKFNKVKLLFIISIFLNIFHNYIPSIALSDNFIFYLLYFGIGYLYFEKIIENFRINRLLSLLLIITISTISVFIVDDIIIIYNTLSIFSNLLLLNLLYLYFEEFRDNVIINFIDKNSFGIYLFHMPIMYIFFRYIPNVYPIILVSINIIVGISVSLLLIYLLRKLKLEFLIGEYRKKLIK